MHSTLIPVTVHHGHQPPVALHGEPTPDPNLIIIPMVERGSRYSGTWRILHIPSGKPIIHLTPLPLGYLRQVAVALAASGIDWSQNQQQLRAHPTAFTVCRQVLSAAHAAHTAREVFGATAATSWQQVPPRWVIRHPDGTELEDDFPSFTAAAEELELRAREHHNLLVTAARLGWEPPPPEWPDYRIARDDQPYWQLRCISPACQGLAEEGQAELLPYTASDRGAMEELAEIEDWVQTGPRCWVCPCCAAEFDLNTVTALPLTG